MKGGIVGGGKKGGFGYLETLDDTNAALDDDTLDLEKRGYKVCRWNQFNSF